MQKVALLLTCYLCIFTSYSFARDTSFIWKADSKKPERGYCIEVDNKTMGKSFYSKVDISKCKPNETHFMFVSKKSKCYEVDSKTSGKNYIKKVKIKYCLPEKTVKEILLINGETACFEADAKTKGEYYHKRIEKSECKNPTSDTFYWKYKSPGSGECFKEVISGEEKLKLRVKRKECRTEKTQYRFIRKDDTSGLCVEEDINDERYYSNKVKTINCKPAETIFVFYKEKSKKQGQCFEIDTETKGNLYINLVEISECAPE